jgi:hypothetical protein
MSSHQGLGEDAVWSCDNSVSYICMTCVPEYTSCNFPKSPLICRVPAQLPACIYLDGQSLTNTSTAPADTDRGLQLSCCPNHAVLSSMLVHSFLPTRSLINILQLVLFCVKRAPGQSYSSGVPRVYNNRVWTFQLLLTPLLVFQYQRVAPRLRTTHSKT